MSADSLRPRGCWSDAADLMIKVPIVITLYFWIVKILATTVGETAADFLAAILGLIVFLSVTRIDAPRLEQSQAA